MGCRPRPVKPAEGVINNRVDENGMTKSDRRALALIVRNNVAAAVPRRTFWRSAGHRIAMVTIRRLEDLGYIEINRTTYRATPTERGRQRSTTDDVSPRHVAG